MIKQRIRLDEESEKTILEALGVADVVRDEALRIIAYLEQHMKDFEPKDNKEYSETECEINLNFGDSYEIPLRITVDYFRNEKVREAYRNRFAHKRPEYSKDDEDITMDIDIVNGVLEDNLLYYLQHEIHHAYQYYCKKKNGLEYVPNTPAYEKAKLYLAYPNNEVQIAAMAVYLWGTHEMSAYENGLYAKLLDNFKTKNEPVSNVIHETPFYDMYTQLLWMFKNMENGYVPEAMEIITKNFKITPNKLKNICGKVVKKAQDMMAKAVTKAKLDYEEWVEKRGMTNSDPYEIKRLKPLSEGQVRIIRKTSEWL